MDAWYVVFYVKVKENEEFVEHIKSFFQNHPKSNTKPALFEHSINEEHEEDEEVEEMTMSEEIRLGSPDDDDVSNQNLLSDFHIEAPNSLGIPYTFLIRLK